jgi:hypothetical protein
MGMPPINGPERFEEISIHGITVWKSNSVYPAYSGRPITLDLWSVFFFGRHLVVKNAR